jgi:hypothetical protein
MDKAIFRAFLPFRKRLSVLISCQRIITPSNLSMTKSKSPCITDKPLRLLQVRSSILDQCDEISVCSLWWPNHAWWISSLMAMAWTWIWLMDLSALFGIWEVDSFRWDEMAVVRPPHATCTKPYFAVSQSPEPNLPSVAECTFSTASHLENLLFRTFFLVMPR